MSKMDREADKIARAAIKKGVKKNNLIDKETQKTFNEIGNYFKDLGNSLKK